MVREKDKVKEKFNYFFGQKVPCHQPRNLIASKQRRKVFFFKKKVV